MRKAERAAERADFAARVRGDHPDNEAEKVYVLAELRLAYRRVTLHRQAITEAAEMIENGVDPEIALSSIGDAMDYVILSPREEDHERE